jgi:hypothetical protein
MPGMPGMGPRPGGIMMGGLNLPAGFPGGPRPGEGLVFTGLCCQRDKGVLLRAGGGCLTKHRSRRRLVLHGINLPAGTPSKPSTARAVSCVDTSIV